MLDPSLTVAEPLLQEGRSCNAQYLRRGLARLSESLCVGLGLALLLSTLVESEQHTKPAITIAWQNTQPGKAQPFLQAASAWQFVQPGKVWQRTQLSRTGIRTGQFMQSTSVVEAATAVAEAKDTSAKVSERGNRKALSLTKFPRTWVPLASTFELNPDRPTPLRFLGQSYVTFRDNDGEWRVMDDACPHRLAPLSEGRIDRETNQLECAYHGWQFAPDSGACMRIPQASEDVAARAKPSVRACVNSYPTRVEKSVLWAWPWPEDPLTFANDMAAMPEGMVSGVDADASTYTRDLPYGWDTLLENIVDPAHIPFAHHGLQGKRSDAIPINMTTPNAIGERGFSFEWGDRTMGMLRAGTAAFRAPYVVSYNAEFLGSDRNFNLTVVCIPTSPGWSRAIVFGGKQPKKGKTDTEIETRQMQKAGYSPGQGGMKKGGASPSIVSKIFRMLPVWAVHLASNRFLDSDLAFLHYQEQTLRSRGAGSDGATTEYFMPAAADRCVAAVRQWIKQYAEVLNPLPPAEYTRSVLFDRYTQHTSHCSHCEAALQGLNKWRKNTYLLLALSLFGVYHWWPARIASVLCLGLLWLYPIIEQQFKVGDYKHWQNN